MIKILALSPLNYNNRAFNAGDVLEVSNNDAFGLIDNGKAERFTPEQGNREDTHFVKRQKERKYRYK